MILYIYTSAGVIGKNLEYIYTVYYVIIHRENVLVREDGTFCLSM
jgi:hypothetical protein